MARKEKEELQVKEEQQEKEEVLVKEEALKVEPKPLIVEDKYVTVIPKINGRRFVGAGWLELKKDKEIRVTKDQARVLREAGAIYL